MKRKRPEEYSTTRTEEILESISKGTKFLCEDNLVFLEEIWKANI